MDKFQEVENILNELNPKPHQQEEDKCKNVTVFLKTYLMMVSLYVKTVE